MTEARTQLIRRKGLFSILRGDIATRIPYEVRAHLTALACSPPEEAWVPVSRWSHADLAAALVRSGAVAFIATSTVWRWLDAERIKPWQHHLWQRPIDPLSVDRVRVVLDLYQRAEALIERAA